MSNNTQKGKEVTIQTSDKEFKFFISQRAFGQFLDGMGKGNISQSTNNFCMMCIAPEQKAELVALFEENMGAALQIAAELQEEVAPSVEAQVKK